MGNGSPTEIYPRLTLKLSHDKSDLNTRNGVKGMTFMKHPGSSPVPPLIVSLLPSQELVALFPPTGC